MGQPPVIWRLAAEGRIGCEKALLCIVKTAGFTVNPAARMRQICRGWMGRSHRGFVLSIFK